MAKLGLLWQNEGRWDGTQIVPAAWLKEASRPHSAGTGWAEGNEYGYGIWVDSSSTPPAIAATGRGGQRIRVVPEKNLIVVLVGRFDVNDVNHFITEAIMSDHAIPEDLEGRTLLEAAIAAAARPSAPRSPSALPPLAGEVSGETFSLDDNPLGLKTLSVSFHSPSEATVRLRFGDGRVEPARSDGLASLLRGQSRLLHGVGGPSRFCEQ